MASREWVVITRDRNISVHQREIDAVRDNGARLVVLSGKEATSIWQQLELLMSLWRGIEQRVDVPGPFITIATRTSLRDLDLDR